MTGYGRGGAHSDNGWPAACLATCYKGVLSIKDKKTWFEKEYHHLHASDGYSKEHISEKNFREIDLGRDGTNVWVGIKFIVYDVDNGEHVKCE